MNYIKRTIILLILFVVVSPINSPKTIADNKYSEIQEDKFQLQPGDIIITKGPVMWGFFGHCVNVNIKMYINDCIRMYKIVC